MISLDSDLSMNKWTIVPLVDEYRKLRSLLQSLIAENRPSVFVFEPSASDGLWKSGRDLLAL